MNQLDNNNFVKSVAQYFMDFLETDFHRHRSPRRAIKLQNSNSLLVGVNLDKYPSFAEKIYELIGNSFNSNSPVTIEKGVYRTDVPKGLVELVELKARKIQKEEINLIVEQVAAEFEENAAVHKKELLIALEKTNEFVREKILSEIVTPFVDSIEDSLKKMNLADEIIVEGLADELTEIINLSVEDVAEGVITRLIAEEEINVKEEISKLINKQIVHEHIVDYFEELKINDLFAEVFELNQNRRILDKQDFYLYFGTINHNKANYPIFYIPFEIIAKRDSYEIDFDSRIFINKKSLEYISQSYNEETGRGGKFQSIKERIIYKAQYSESDTALADRLDEIISELTNYFEIDKNVSVSSKDRQSGRNKYLKISNDLYFSLYDKSDEALINDYEEILSLDEGSPLFGELSDLVNDFVTKDPTSVSSEVDDKWDEKESTDRIVSESPIPLNGEQRKILSALSDDDCRYVSVEGPPGTGKSHTITAIVFDAILNNQSVLVLSDKKEALDVVEDKISATMNEVRFEDDFQNPVLRLGKTGNTYKQILSPSSIEKIKTNYKAVKKQFSELETYLAKSLGTLKEDLSAESTILEQVEISEIHELVNLEKYINKNVSYVDFEELVNANDSSVELEQIRASLNRLMSYSTSEDAKSLLRMLGAKDDRLLTMGVLKVLQKLLKKIETIRNELDEKSLIDSIHLFNSFTGDEMDKLYRFLKRYEALRKPIIGFAFNKNKVSELDIEFNESFDSTLVDAHERISDLGKFYEAMVVIEEHKNMFNEKASDRFDVISIVFEMLKEFELLEGTVKYSEDIEFLEEMSEKYESTFIKSQIKDNDEIHFGNKLVEASDLEVDKILRYVVLYQKIRGKFSSIPSYNYLNAKNQIERLATIKMTYLMDQRVVDFYENHAATVKVLKEIISSKEKFPRDEFSHLKNAFPCILAGIRDYAEYIPLERNLFDLVIIDEASQVSVAQAFPALLRAKKVLILGDKLQFGNVKSAQAKSTVNSNYTNDLRAIFKQNVSEDASALKKLEYFNVKKSILDFFEFISNYKSMLRKHFRGYKENISYSNKYFYGQSLQVMKIRGKPVSDVIKFSFIEHDGKKEQIPNTNIPEIEFIKEEINNLIESGSRQSVGIITPHTNQQKKLNEIIYKSFDRDALDKQLRLKIMTFDTCQGEERDIVFYSMVATNEDDKLQYIFSTDFKAGSYDEGLDDLRRQRLNVGLSRSKETMHFVLSKPIEEYRGAARTALMHYKEQLDASTMEKPVDSVDEKSPMEKKVLHWFYQTDFWNKNKENIEFDTQFEIGIYLKQLDPTYSHPNYKVDFLMVYRDESEKYHKVVIEYDGFEEHFVDKDLVNEYNYGDYYSESDLERQKTLESYGYKFLRINKFNVGENPVKTLDERITSLLTVQNLDNHSLFQKINSTIQGINNGDIRECPKCGEIKELDDFKDSSLITGYGRFCMECKGQKNYTKSSEAQSSTKICSDCGSTMKLRNGRYGKFYGCSRYPYCKNTLKA